jgi:hypothetical protein
MVERVAAALWSRQAHRDFGDPTLSVVLFGPQPQKIRAVFMEEARAVIAAMRYVDGVDEELFVLVSAEERFDPVSLIGAWDRVIDAALSSPPY